eukprot:scaffold68511_cov43-Cyclotella_meneghiniana.AAC.1
MQLSRATRRLPSCGTVGKQLEEPILNCDFIGGKSLGQVEQHSAAVADETYTWKFFDNGCF